MTLQAAAATQFPNTQLLFAVGVIVVVSVVAFTTAVIVTLLRRGDRRRAEEARLAALGTAAARILHQVKNPVQTIVLNADMIQDERIVADAAQRREVAEAIVGESERLMAMLDELSVYVGGARRSLNRRPVRLDDLVAQVARHEARESAGTGVEVDATALAEATVNGDAYYLRQVFDNLVRNAREAMEKHPGERRLSISVARAGGNAEARVSDTGPGIAPEDLRLVFDPFRSTKVKGMGLGLAICREIVEGHGGRISVDSAPGKGATFTVTIPLHSEAAG